MRLLSFVAPLVLMLGTATADPKTEKAEPAKCKPTVVGRGLERKVVCVFEQEIEVRTSAKPQVVYVTKGGKSVTGRPRSEDRTKGLSRRLR